MVLYPFESGSLCILSTGCP